MERLRSGFALNAMFEDSINRLYGEDNDLPQFFDYSVVDKVPYVKCPLLTEDENRYVFLMAQEALIYSKRYNHYRETAITCCSDMPIEECIHTKGEEDMVNYLDDPKVLELLQSTSEMMILVSHNHPNNSELSFQDIAIFCSRPNIKYMGAVGHDGSISCIIRSIAKKYDKIIDEVIRALLPADITREHKSNVFSYLKHHDPKLLHQMKTDLLDMISKDEVHYFPV